MIALVCAVAQELQWFAPRRGVEVLVTGIGPVEAALSVANFLAARSCQLVVSAGIAGAFRGAASIGDGVVVTEEFFELNLETGESITLPDGSQTIGRARSSALDLVAAVGARGFKVARGITVARVTATDATASRLRGLGADVESMEGFAVLRAAGIADISAIEVRGISNYVGARATSEWDFAAGIAGLQRVTEALLAEATLFA